MLSPNTILQNRYRIIRQLSAGGMGTVYEAVDERLDTTVALKECHFTDERLRKQFEREARLLARLRHPAMTRVIDHFNEGDGQFLVMDFIMGEDLSEMLQRRGRAFQPDEVLKWGDQLLDALNYLHTQDPPIVHRDIKPQNIKLTTKGHIMLLDFGLAKGFAGQISRVTTSGSIFGYTPNYAPLEQIQGTGTDPRSDLYSLAATIYHLITGTAPPDVLTRLTATTDGLPDPLRPANEVNPQLSTEVAAVLHRAMMIGRNQRLASAAEMQRLLHEAKDSQTLISSGKEKSVLMPTIVASPVQNRSAQGQEATPLMPTVADSTSAQRAPEPESTVTAGSELTVAQQKSQRDSSSFTSLSAYNSADSRNSHLGRFAIPALIVLIVGFSIFYALQRETSVAKRDEPVASVDSNQNDTASSPVQNSSAPSSVQVNTAPSPVKGSPTPSPAKSSPTPNSTLSPSAASKSETQTSEEPPPVQKTTPVPEPVREAPISGGVLNGKAISLPKPAYPAIAKSAHASGTVTVQVLIDENGSVIAAHAISGHPLLQAVSVAAARTAKFSPTTLAGQRVKVSGVITYNFVAQ